MYVRQSLTICLIFSAFSCSNYPRLKDNDIIRKDIVELNNQMEEHFRKENLEEIASLYLSNAYLLTPQRTITGKEDITDYWLSIRHPLDWNLEVIEVTQVEDQIYQNEYYEALENKPPGWRQRGIKFDEDTPKVYQLGRSRLKTLDENGNEQESVVDFILVWEVQPNASYRILLDTYTWQ